MTFFQLKCFCSVVEYKSFTEASYALNISQSSLSKQIKNLESELNTQLLFRNKHCVIITSAGEDFLCFARKCLVEYNRVLESTKGYSRRIQLRLGCIHNMGRAGLTRAIGSFLNAYPSVDVSIESTHTLELLEKLDSGLIDIAFIAHVFSIDGRESNTDGYPPGRFDITTLMKDEYKLVVNQAHPFANRTSISWKELEGENLVLLNNSYSVNTYINQACAQNGFKPTRYFESDQVDTLLEMVADNRGLAILSGRIAMVGRDLKMLSLVPPIIRNTAMVTHSKNRNNEFIQSFSTHVFRFFTENQII